MSDKRIYEIDSLRGIAALVVVLTHFQPFFWTKVVHWGFLAVDLFFILSGFVLTRTYERQVLSGSITARNFLARRFARLAPLHYLAMGLLGIMDVASWATGHGHVFNWYMPLYSFFLNLLFLQNVGLTNEMTWNDVSWSISTEMAVNLIWFYALSRLRPTVALFAAAIVAASLFIFTTMGPNLDFTFANKFGINIGLVRCIMGFSLGVVMARLMRPGICTPSAAGHVTAVAVLALMAWVGYSYREPGMEGADYVVVLFLYPALLFLALDNRTFLSPFLRWRPLVFLGDISYSVYLMHPLVAKLMSRIAKGLQPPWLGLISVLIVLVVATATFYFFERPARRYLTKRLTTDQRPEHQPAQDARQPDSERASSPAAAS